MLTAALILLAAILADAAFGDPVYRLHPVRLMGQAINASENHLRKKHLAGLDGGLLLLAVMLVLFGGGSFLFLILLQKAGCSAALTVFAVFLLYSSIALNDMVRHAEPVAKALREKNLPVGRQKVQKIVGRNADLLDEEGVARAAVESVAEGFVDGFLSPLFWFCGGAALAVPARLDPVAAGTACAMIYRVTNTLDSMVGYRNERYRHFGKASARFDDILNFIPARLAIPVLTCAAYVTGLKTKNCWQAGLRDRLKHASPNAGHAESCVAGALGIRLGGPTVYPHGTVDKPWLGDGSGRVGAERIESCCRLIRMGGWLSLVLFFSFLLALHLAGF